MKVTENVKRTLAVRPIDKVKLSEYCVRFIMAVMLGRIRIFGGFSPFGAAFVGAAPGGTAGIVTMAGVCLGALISGGLVWSVKYIAIAILVWATIYFFADACPGWFPMAVVFGVTGVIGAVFAWDAQWEIQAAALWVVETFLSAGCVFFYSSALAPWSDNARRDARAAHAASLVILLATLLMSLSSLELFGVLSIGRCAAVVVIMFVTLRGGMGMGCVSAAALGAAMDLAQGGVPFFVMSYTLTALIAGVFAKNGRLAFVLSWVASGAVTVLWFWGSRPWMMALFENFAASVIFMLLPDEFLTRVAVFLPTGGGGFGFLKAREYTRDRVELCAQAFRGLYEAVRGCAGDDLEENIDKVYDRAAEAVCRTCPNSARCWQENYVDTVDVMNNLTPVIMKNGRVEAGDLPQRFVQSCQHPDRLVEALNGEARAFLTRRQYRSRISENRTAAFEQYNDVSAVLHALARELGEEITVEPGLERKLQKYLRGLAIDASVAIFRVRGGRLRAEIRSSSLNLLRRDGLWLDKLSQVLGTRLCTWDGPTDPDRLVLLQAEPLAVHIGVSSAKKSGETVSGDKCLYFRTDEGMLYVLLSDGMGSGPDAARMSGAALSILDRFLRAGLRPELALRILSDLMLLKSDVSLESATVDLLSFNMFTGDALLYKFGAAPSYIKRGSSVKRMAGSALPVGFKPGIRRQGARVPLSPDSVLVMTSDGVISGSDDRWLRTLLSQLPASDVPALSKRILTAATEHVGSADDMTVIAMSFEERK